MNNKEIKELIKSLKENSNKFTEEQLKEIKQELLKINKSKEKVLNKTQFDKSKDILLANLYEFIKEEEQTFTKEHNYRRSCNTSALYRAINDIVLKKRKEQNNESLGAVKIYETFGIDKEELLKRRYVGKKSIKSYEDDLNKYGLSMNVKLTLDQKVMLSKEHAILDKKEKEVNNIINMINDNEKFYNHNELSEIREKFLNNIPKKRIK